MKVYVCFQNNLLQAFHHKTKKKGTKDMRLKKEMEINKGKKLIEKIQVFKFLTPNHSQFFQEGM
jgi:hypothetical protein